MIWPIRLYVIIGAFLCTLKCLPVPAQALTLEGNLVQGGMAIGIVDPATRVVYDGQSIRVSPEGLFVIGFSRDAPTQAVLELHQPSGTIEKQSISVKKRTYTIQRIDGLPPRKVSPSAEDLKRIRKEIALVKKVRKRDDPRTDFRQAFIWPVTGRISGVYGSQRILNDTPKRPHFGVDIAAPTGAPVKAPAGGMVSLVHEDMFYSGGTLILDHGHGLSTTYMHLHKILVTEGQTVNQGDIIAQVGATGRVTGPHLHWGMNWFETRLDPSLMVPPMPQVKQSAKTHR